MLQKPASRDKMNMPHGDRTSVTCRLCK